VTVSLHKLQTNKQTNKVQQSKCYYWWANTGCVYRSENRHDPNHISTHFQ